MNANKRAYLSAMGIPVWYARSREPNADIPASAVAPVEPQSEENSLSLDWGELQSAVRGCTKCPLHQSRTNTVFGSGNSDANWLIVGEAPGADEDRQGQPFVGRAGQLLTEMLRALGLERESVYIANTLKCRPPNNRDPSTEEAAACAPYLQRQIELLSPRVILAVGRVAAQLLLERNSSLGRMRGQKFTYRNTGIPVVVTYHPAYLLRKPIDKSKSWLDLKMARDIASEPAQ